MHSLIILVVEQVNRQTTVQSARVLNEVLMSILQVTAPTSLVPGYAPTNFTQDERQSLLACMRLHGVQPYHILKTGFHALKQGSTYNE